MGPAAIAFLAEGKLYLKQGDGAPQLVESVFAQQILDRVERNRQRNDWKEGMAWSFATQRMQLGVSAAGEVRSIRFTGVAAGRTARELFYAIDTDYVGALFEYDPKEGYERRLFHRNHFRPRDLCCHGESGMLAFSLPADDGTACITVIDPQGRGLREVTEGDSVDEAPSWAAGGDKAIVFQSAGVGRNQMGMRIALGCYAIQKLDLDSGQLSTLLEDDATDYLLPRMAADGSLYFIRRPYEARPTVSPLRVGLDIVLFPFRLVRAIVHFLNVFSMMFSRKPLLTAGGPPREGPDARVINLFGRVIDAQKALRKGGAGAVRSLVPSSWQLVRRSSGGQEQVLASGVVGYDLCPDGSIIYTNGTSVFHLRPGGEPREICAGHLVERVAALAKAHAESTPGAQEQRPPVL